MKSIVFLHSSNEQIIEIKINAIYIAFKLLNLGINLTESMRLKTQNIAERN